jgi:hypothetical protein
MPRRYFTALLLLCFIHAYPQSDQNSWVSVSGKISDSTLQPVAFAHIININRELAWISDYNGNFYAYGYPGDTLTFSAISYQKALLVIPRLTAGSNYQLGVQLKSDTVQLKEIVIHPWPATISQLRQELLEVEVEDPLENLDLHLPSPEELKMLAVSLEGGFGVKVPLISMIYNQFSKEAKSKKLYKEALRVEKASLRYNKSVVSKITGLKNEDALYKFMEYCALQVSFILESTDYELYAAIMDCYEDYCKLPGVQLQE